MLFHSIGYDLLGEHIPNLNIYKDYLPFEESDSETDDETVLQEEKNKQLATKISKAIFQARLIYFNCTGMKPEIFKQETSKVKSSFTNYELTLLYKLRNMKKIIWIQAPLSDGWKRQKSIKAKVKHWWENKRSAIPFCHKEIKNKLELKRI